MKDTLKNLTKDMWNIPNALTMARLVMIPVFAVLYFTGRPIAALAVFCAASLTDLLDGFLARRLNQITDFGKLFDPLADQLMVLTALVCHTVSGVFPWPAVAVVAAKELLMVAGGALLLKRDVVVYANLWGKAATCAFIAALILGFFHAPLAQAGVPADRIALWLAVALTLAALGRYAWQAWPKLFPRKPD